MKARLLRILIILLILALNIGCDQVSKSIVRHKMNDYTYIGYLNNHITLSKVENSGAFLSIGDSLPKPFKIIILNLFPLAVVVFGLIFVFIKTSLNRVILFGLIMVIGGGIGNLYDRMVHGSVTDFMHINFVIFQTGIFNLADMSIMIGMFIMVFYAWFKKPDAAENQI
jgi:signal peptidase II